MPRTLTIAFCCCRVDVSVLRQREANAVATSGRCGAHSGGPRQTMPHWPDLSIHPGMNLCDVPGAPRCIRQRGAADLRSWWCGDVRGKSPCTSAPWVAAGWKPRRESSATKMKFDLMWEHDWGVVASGRLGDGSIFRIISPSGTSFAEEENLGGVGVMHQWWQGSLVRRIHSCVFHG